jgi:predicted kinase
MKHLSLTKPHVIVMVGIPGSGKTFFAEKFAETFHAPYVNYGKIAALAGESADQLMEYQLNELLKTGQSVIVEGNTDTRTARIELAKKARAAGYEPLLVWVQTDLATAKARAAKTSGLTGDDYDKAVKRFTAPTPPEKPVVLSGKHTSATQAKVILQRLSAPRADISTHSTPPTRLEQPTRRNITIR